MAILPPPRNNAIVVFDLDGTLVDSARDLIGTLNKVIVKDGLPEIDPALVGHMVGQGALKMLSRAYAHFGKDLDDDKRSHLHKIFLELYEVHIADETIPFEGTLDVLDDLKTAGWTMAVCTNKYEGMSNKLLKLLKMDHYFDAVCGSDTFPVRKPDPKHLWGTIEDANGDKSAAIMVGDSSNDVDTARNANIPVIGVTFGYTDKPMAELKPDELVSHYSEMPNAINALAERF